MELPEKQIRAGFRLFNRAMLLMWRLGLGWQMANPMSGYIMVLATTGRRSGDRRLVPLNFAEDADVVYCLAGFGKATHWLLNLQADPTCEVWLPDGRRLHGRGHLVTSEGRRTDLVREILVRSGFAAKVAEPGIDLAAAADEIVAGLGPRPGHRYEVVEIKLGDAVTGPGGPGDLKWVWLVLPVAYFFMRRFRRRRNDARQCDGIERSNRTQRGASSAPQERANDD